MCLGLFHVALGAHLWTQAGATQHCFRGDQLMPCCAAPAGRYAALAAEHDSAQRLRRRLAVPGRPARCGRGDSGRAARRDGCRRSAHRREGTPRPHAPRGGLCRASGAHRHGDDQGTCVVLRFGTSPVPNPVPIHQDPGSCDSSMRKCLCDCRRHAQGACTNTAPPAPAVQLRRALSIASLLFGRTLLNCVAKLEPVGVGVGCHAGRPREHSAFQPPSIAAMPY
jgi:hypothetical protein